MRKEDCAALDFSLRNIAGALAAEIGAALGAWMLDRTQHYSELSR